MIRIAILACLFSLGSAALTFASDDTVRLAGSWRAPASWSGDELCIPDDRKVFMVPARPDVVR